VKRRIGWDKIIFTHVVIIGVPAILYYYLRVGGASLFWLHAAVATVYLITALMIIYEATAALFRRYAGSAEEPTGSTERWKRKFKDAFGVSGAHVPEPTRPLPRCSFIVAAYLPNEQDIIIETLTEILDNVHRPEAGFELILAYNRPVRLPIEDELERLAARHESLRLLHVETSESKAENINAALPILTGEIVGILDADHHPQPDCFKRAWRWFERGYDVVQGRNVVRNSETNFMTKMISVEFECTYGVCHAARSLFVDTGIFGGSNGYWRTEVLRETRFDPTMLTEDIDATSRALLAGYRILNDRSIISTEIAPTDLPSFWYQRQRWAQGWLEVSIKFQVDFWKSRHLSFLQKIYWTYLLLYREVYPLLALQIYPILLSLLLLQGYIELTSHWYLWLTAIVTFASGPYQTAVAAKIAFERHHFLRWAVYAFCVFFFTLFKAMISLVAMYDHLLGRADWVVTRRSMTEQSRKIEARTR
jgi:cellulose synthase/poly-beta-1,6-N-acetylglucosamine synthase-like glycosyltransferase